MDGQPSAWTVNRISIELEMNRRTVGRLLRNVEPVRVEGRSKLYRLRDLVDAYAEKHAPEAPAAPTDNVRSLAAARERKTAAQAALAELELERARGRLVPVDEVEEALTSIVLLLKQHLLALPDRGAQLTYGAESQAEHREVWRQVVHEILTEIASEADKLVDPANPAVADADA